MTSDWFSNANLNYEWLSIIVSWSAMVSVGRSVDSLLLCCQQACLYLSSEAAKQKEGVTWDSHSGVV